MYMSSWSYPEDFEGDPMYTAFRFQLLYSEIEYLEQKVLSLQAKLDAAAAYKQEATAIIVHLGEQTEQMQDEIEMLTSSLTIQRQDEYYQQQEILHGDFIFPDTFDEIPY